MKHRFLSLFLIALSLSVFAAEKNPSENPKGYSIKVKVNGLKDTVCYLAYHFGDKQYLKDTATVDGKGNMVFDGKEKLPGGIYLVVLPNKTNFEFLVTEDEEFFSLETDTTKMIEHMKVSGSKENELFFGFLKYLGKKTKDAEPYLAGYKRNKNKDSVSFYQNKLAKEEKDSARYRASYNRYKDNKNKDSVAFYQQKLALEEKNAELYRAGLKRSKDNKDKIKDSVTYFQNKLTEEEKEVKAHRNKVIEENPRTLVSKIFRASTELEPPEAPTLPNGRKDSTFAYYWMKQHYFDNVDFSDDKILRTPLLQSKIKYYLENLTPQAPDSINKAADFIVGKAAANKDVYKYCIWNITNMYETSNIMGMDAIFVHMAETYYLSGKAFWIDSTVQKKIRERYETLKPLLLGKKAPQLSLPDTSNNFHDLYAQPGKYTVIYFWDPHCGHCQKETPRLNEYFKKDAKKQNVSIYAVGTDNPADWKKYVREKKLLFLNVCNAIGDKTVYYDLRKGYDVYSTPTIYVLDDKKEIIAKKLGVEQLKEFIDNYSKMMDEKNKKKTVK